MKKITQLSVALLITGVLTACGGGGGSTTPSNSTNNSNNTSNPTTDSAGLIIDNGRGTVNNQDTEKPK